MIFPRSTVCRLSQPVLLEEHDFSREEIRQEVLDVAKRMGALYAVAAIMDEDP